MDIPFIKNQSFYTASQAVANKKVLDSIYSKYKDIIDQVAQINAIPTALITSIIFIESKGNENAKLANAYGLMQVDPKSCTDTITRERTKKRLTDPEKAILKKELGQAKYDAVMKAKLGDTIITVDDVKNPHINVILGTMAFVQILDEESKGSTEQRIDRAIVRYNKGYYYNKMPKGVSAEQLVAQSPKDLKDYILKLGGKNGTLDSLV